MIIIHTNDCCTGSNILFRLLSELSTEELCAGG